MDQLFEKLFFRLCLGLTMIGIVVGCGATASGPTPTPTPDITVGEIVQRTSEEMLAVSSLHFITELSGALDYIDRPPTTALKRVEGDLLRPDKVQAEVKVSSLGIISNIGLISVAGDSYVTNPINQRWERLPPEWGWFFDPRLPFDDTYGIPAVIPEIPMEKIGVEEIEGETYYRLEGVAQGEQVLWWTAGMVREGEVPVEIWIDTETFLISQVQMTELASDLENPTVWNIQFSNYNQPLDIQAPPVAEK